ncbi:hypothetical protein [Bradyrhizobium sp. NAS96.2]|uniref:hypothetical protein n=1 Tax=Bradyrhizobium sp. NAS96.2 TaxID=1680160 RepID=UPI000938A24B|nr:hypothetical protein [Bradyrhizobium sp. NAS96.2]OKO70912.1 hypothetical protein AC628_29635 [Bradyrhizobium sp. NAS96.2]
MSKEKRGSVPLQEVRELSYSKEGGPVIVSTRTRGFLLDVGIKTHTGALSELFFQPNGKEVLSALSDRLRVHLTAKNLPTDKTPLAPIQGGCGYTPQELALSARDDAWFEIARDSTEPLSEDRLAAELLHAITLLFAKFSDDELSDIYRAMYLYQLHSAAGELNELAVDGKISRGNRAKGSQAKKSKGELQRQLILSIARDFWHQHPKLNGQPWNTAKKIADAVNKERAKLRLGREPLAAKTISDHLRIALEEAGVQP